MADQVAELQGLRVRLHDLGNGMFQPAVHDASGPAGANDASIEIQGFRILMHDNGDGTFSFGINPGTVHDIGAGTAFEFRGIRIHLFSIPGKFITIDGVSNQLYAIATTSGLPAGGDLVAHEQGFYIWTGLNTTYVPPQFEVGLAIGAGISGTDKSLEWQGFRIQLVFVGPASLFIGDPNTDGDVFAIGAFQI